MYGCFCELGVFFGCPSIETPYYLGTVLGPLIFGTSHFTHNKILGPDGLQYPE